MIKVLVNGAFGRMGQETVAAINATDDLILVGEADKEDPLPERILHTRPDVVVDFTAAGAGYQNTVEILQGGARPVIGTSGFDAAQVEELKGYALQRKLGGIIAPNFALGGVLMMKFAREAAKYFTDVEIVELHHERKLDAPSGTAIRTAELIAETRQRKEAGRGDNAPARGERRNGVPIHSIRLPGLVAHQKVLFGGTSEVLTLSHDSMHREAFMPGVLLACRKVMELNELVYGLETIL
jgi:4-hydroxy-tetrahydrodipicolinate reductase